jgi:hypothetical protein
MINKEERQLTENLLRFAQKMEEDGDQFSAYLFDKIAWNFIEAITSAKHESLRKTSQTEPKPAQPFEAVPISANTQKMPNLDQAFMLLEQAAAILASYQNMPQVKQNIQQIFDSIRNLGSAFGSQNSPAMNPQVLSDPNAAQDIAKQMFYQFEAPDFVPGQTSEDLGKAAIEDLGAFQQAGGSKPTPINIQPPQKPAKEASSSIQLKTGEDWGKLDGTTKVLFATPNGMMVLTKSLYDLMS